MRGSYASAWCLRFSGWWVPVLVLCIGGQLYDHELFFRARALSPIGTLTSLRSTMCLGLTGALLSESFYVAPTSPLTILCFESVQT